MREEIATVRNGTIRFAAGNEVYGKHTERFGNILQRSSANSLLPQYAANKEMPNNRLEVIISLLILRLNVAFIEQPFCHNWRETPDDAYVGSRPRTAARHWMAVGDGGIERYQINAPTTWNFSPRISFDADGPL
ncbi:nickel-dependent hydrogenase large subunit [Bradyrhizobium sp. 25ACV]